MTRRAASQVNIPTSQRCRIDGGIRRWTTGREGQRTKKSRAELDSGLPSEFILKPASTKAHEWPIPTRHMEAGDILTIGYGWVFCLTAIQFL
jgi:hypothetical protein